jgi:hypothetical protein
MRSYVFLLLIVTAPFSTLAANEEDYVIIESQSGNNSCCHFFSIGSRHKKKTKNKKYLKGVKQNIQNWQYDFEDTGTLLSNFELTRISYKGEVDDETGDIRFDAEFTGREYQKNTMIVEYGIELSDDGNSIKDVNAKATYPSKLLNLTCPKFYQSGGLGGKKGRERLKKLRIFNLFILKQLFNQLERASEKINTQNDIENLNEFMDTFREHPLFESKYGKSMKEDPKTKRAMEDFFEKYYPVSKLKILIDANKPTN